jgi:hypothetical protein
VKAKPDSATAEVVATYRARRAQLLREASEDERQDHPVKATFKRQRARLMSLYIASELIDREPEGIGSFQ